MNGTETKDMWISQLEYLRLNDMNKKLRNSVFMKYNVCCAYCGATLNNGFHVDRITPKIFGGTDEFDNLNPACRDCNTYKSATRLEEYRTQLLRMLNEKPEYLFKSKTKFEVAKKMGSITHKPWDGLFYFEKLNKKWKV